ncbi:hypothetical protein ACQKMZ_28595 [Bacillus paramycoides]|uniref:hypothetical protein n=1 Tax=Bacillus paramycoides TaxID=2026194 RepID=UPI003D02DFCF
MSSKSDACLTNEVVLIQSVVCSKKIRLIAHTNVHVNKIKDKNIQLIPDPLSVKIDGTLLTDLIVIQGFIKGRVIIDGKCIEKITLQFQEEVICEGVCSGDKLKHTNPILEGILPPQIIPQEEYQNDCIVFKVILSIQATVIREKLGTIAVSIIGDINENRCQPQFNPTSVITCEVEKEPCECHHRNHKDTNDDCLCTCEDCDD